MTPRIRTFESFLQPVVVVLFLAYPEIASIARGDQGLSSPWIAGEFVLPVVLGFVVGRYWTAALAPSVAVWFFVDLARGRYYAVHDWHQHTGFEVVAMLIFVAIFAALVALGVRVRRRLSRPPERDPMVDKLAAVPPRSRRRPVSGRDLRWFIAGAVVLFAASLFMSGIANLVTATAAVILYFGGWLFMRRRAGKSPPTHDGALSTGADGE
jgi:hypothetical protein